MTIINKNKTMIIITRIKEGNNLLLNTAYQRMGIRLLWYFYHDKIQSDWNMHLHHRDEINADDNNDDEWNKHFQMIHKVLSIQVSTSSLDGKSVRSMTVMDVELVQLLASLLQHYTHNLMRYNTAGAI